jgi:hypothetical protein
MSRIADIAGAEKRRNRPLVAEPVGPRWHRCDGGHCRGEKSVNAIPKTANACNPVAKSLAFLREALATLDPSVCPDDLETEAYIRAAEREIADFGETVDFEEDDEEATAEKDIDEDLAAAIRETNHGTVYMLVGLHLLIDGADMVVQVDIDGDIPHAPHWRGYWPAMRDAAKGIPYIVELLRRDLLAAAGSDVFEVANQIGSDVKGDVYRRLLEATKGK